MDRQQNNAEAAPPPAMETLRILFLEDVPVEAQLVESELRRARIQCVIHRVASRETFEAALREGGYDLIFADYKLPSFDGISALAIAQELCSSIPFILISGQISEKMAVEAVSGGATDYVFKDHLPRLVPSVHRALREVRERQRRRVAEKALQMSEQRYRLLVERSRDGIIQFDNRGRAVFVNPAAAEIIGCERSHLLARPELLERLLHPACREQFQSALEEFRATASLPLAPSEWMWVRADGKRIFTENLFTDLSGDDGRVIGFQMVLRDITDKTMAATALRDSYRKLRRIFGQTVNCLSSAVEKRDPYTGGHQHRVAQLARRVAEEMKLAPDHVEGIFLTGLPHDVGKINIPAEILSRPGRLSEAELLIIRTHPEVGYQILKDVEFPWPVATAVVQHHEHLDGTGYPSGLTGDQIVLEARILTVADVLEGMSSHRPYRPGHGLRKAIHEVCQHSGTRYDPRVVETGRKLFEEKGFHFVAPSPFDYWTDERPLAKTPWHARVALEGCPPSCYHRPSRSVSLSRARAFVAAGLVLWVALACGEALCAPQIIKGPYLQQVTQDSIVVMWETDVAAPSRVDYGRAAPGELFVEDPSPHTIHEVELTGLAAGTAYRYNVTSGETTSVTSTFAAAPEFPQPFRMVVYGDSRSYPATHAAVTAGIAASRPDIVLHTGDLVSGGGYSEFDQQFFTPAHDLMLDTPVLPCLGNHENNSSSFFDLFSLPGNERWFAFTYGCARVICLDTNADYSPGSAQNNWLLSELTSAECAAATWRIVYFHSPPYTATSGHGDDRGVRQDLVPLFEQHGVHAVFAGHSHAYERYANNGIVYIVTGGGGAPLYGLRGRSDPPPRLAGGSVYHFVVADVNTVSMRIGARRSNGKEFDAIELFSPNEPPAAAPDAYATDEDVALNVPAPGVLGNDSDPDRNPLRAVLVAGAQHGALALSPDGSFVYVPDANYHGDDSFTYRANNGRADSSVVTVSIVINSVNDPPVARADTALTEQGATANIPVLANDSDADGDPLAITALTQPTNGLATHDGATVTYTPAPGFTGTDTFTYTAGDGSGATATATVSVLVTPYARPDIHGRIADGAGNGIAGVLVKLKGLYGTKWKAEAATDALGFYTFGNLPLGTYSAKPKLKGWTLAPRDREVPLAAPTDHLPADFIGTAK